MRCCFDQQDLGEAPLSDDTSCFHSSVYTPIWFLSSFPSWLGDLSCFSSCFLRTCFSPRRQQKAPFTYGEFAEVVDRAAHGFLAHGLGDRIGIWAQNNVEWLVAAFAAAPMGAVLVNVNSAYKAPGSNMPSTRSSEYAGILVIYLKALYVWCILFSILDRWAARHWY